MEVLKSARISVFVDGLHNSNTFNFQWDIIRPWSFVAITASEGQRGVDEIENYHFSTVSPRKFVGAVA